MYGLGKSNSVDSLGWPRFSRRPYLLLYLPSPPLSSLFFSTRKNKDDSSEEVGPTFYLFPFLPSFLLGRNDKDREGRERRALLVAGYLFSSPLFPSPLFFLQMLE